MSTSLTTNGARQAIVRYLKDNGPKTIREIKGEFGGWPAAEILLAAERAGETAYNSITDRWEDLTGKPRSIHKHMVFAPRSGRATPPCNGCDLCCTLEVVLGPADDPDWYELEEKTKGKAVLKRKRKGYCAHRLQGIGCGVHDRAPMSCKLFDCAHMVLAMTGAQIKNAVTDTKNAETRRRARIVARGLELLSRGYRPAPRSMIEVKKQ